MQHVLGIETVVAQLVVHYLVGRKIFHHVRIVGDKPVGGKQEHGFRQRAAVKAIFGIAYGAHRHYDSHIRIA